MQGLSRAAASPVPIQFNGETLLLPPLSYSLIGIVEQHILSMRKSPLDTLREMLDKFHDLPPSVQEKLVERAYEDAKKLNSVSTEDFDAFVHTSEGLTFTMWVLFEKQYPRRFTIEEVGKIIDAMTPADLDRLRKAQLQAGGMDDWGNSTGPALSEAGPPKQ